MKIMKMKVLLLLSFVTVLFSCNLYGQLTKFGIFQPGVTKISIIDSIRLDTTIKIEVNSGFTRYEFDSINNINEFDIMGLDINDLGINHIVLIFIDSILGSITVINPSRRFVYALVENYGISDGISDCPYFKLDHYIKTVKTGTSLTLIMYDYFDYKRLALLPPIFHMDLTASRHEFNISIIDSSLEKLITFKRKQYDEYKEELRKKEFRKEFKGKL